MQFHPQPRIKYKMVSTGEIIECAKVTTKARRPKCIGWRETTRDPGQFANGFAAEVARTPDMAERLYLWGALLADPKRSDVLYDAKASWAKAKKLLS